MSDQTYTAAELEEAVAFLEYGLSHPNRAHAIENRHLRTILRFVQSPRLTGERLEAVRKAHERLHMLGYREVSCGVLAQNLSAAFPEIEEG